MIRKIIPPEHTYKCTIYKTGACNPKSRLYILIDGKRYMELDVREKGNVFWQDWYGNEFGLEYIPCPDQVGSFDEGDMKVFVTFNY